MREDIIRLAEMIVDLVLVLGDDFDEKNFDEDKFIEILARHNVYLNDDRSVIEEDD
jgi:hypothetical protein